MTTAADDSVRHIVITACEEHAGISAIHADVPWHCIYCGGPRGEPIMGLLRWIAPPWRDAMEEPVRTNRNLSCHLAHRLPTTEESTTFLTTTAFERSRWRDQLAPIEIP
jgi:hypothetical protein